jgi:hypothetical protein
MPDPIILMINALFFVACLGAWLRFCERTMASPLFLYLVFHFLNFVVRPILIYVGRGDGCFFSWFIGLQPGSADHHYALIVASLALFMFVTGGIFGEAFARRRPMAARIPALNPLYVKLVGALFIAMGLLSLVGYGAMPWSTGEGAGSPVKIVNSDEGFAYINESSSYITQFYVFSLGVLVVWVACFGLRYWVTATLIAFIFLMVYNGSVSGRNTYVISGYAIVLALMARTRRSWPSLLSIITLILICLSFMMGKHWLKSIVEGHGRDPAGPPVAVADTPFSESDVFINYDMFLTITTLIPDLADHTHFSLYGRPFHIWIPRVLWPDKPIFDFPAAYIQSRIKSIQFIGLVVTIPGESYLAFGVPGVVVLMALFGGSLSFVCTYFSRYPASSVESLFSIELCACLIQIYRDGIVSLPLFLMYYFAPCLAMLLLTALVNRRHPSNVQWSPA